MGGLRAAARGVNVAAFSAAESPVVEDGMWWLRTAGEKAKDCEPASAPLLEALNAEELAGCAWSRLSALWVLALSLFRSHGCRDLPS